MSFILDALKKSESDRQRQGGPALFEVKVAPPRHGLPPWAVAIAVLFVANLAVVAWLLVRHAAAPAEARTQAASVPPAASVPASLPAPPPAPVTAPAVSAMSASAAAAAAAVTPPAHGLATAPALVEEPAEAPAAAAAAEPPPNPDDFAPAAEPSSGSLGRVKRGTDAGVPLYQQLATAAGSQVPQLRLDLHAYAERAEDRWVLINMHKLHEGESLEGVRVERITPDGAVLSYRGSQFLLTQE